MLWLSWLWTAAPIYNIIHINTIFIKSFIHTQKHAAYLLYVTVLPTLPFFVSNVEQAANNSPPGAPWLCVSVSERDEATLPHTELLHFYSFS